MCTCSIDHCPVSEIKFKLINKIADFSKDDPHVIPEKQKQFLYTLSVDNLIDLLICSSKEAAAKELTTIINQ